jgi:hypothetical protein
MELNVETLMSNKRLPPAQEETTWTGELEQNTGILPILISGPNYTTKKTRESQIKPTQQTPHQQSESQEDF